MLTAAAGGKRKKKKRRNNVNEEKLFVIYGAGDDDIGLVGKITSPLAEAGANIVDLRQDALHGLFTLYLIADFSDTEAGIEEIRAILAGAQERTGFALAVRPFQPVPRDPGKKNLLVILVGEDKPGVAAKISATLGRYQINIEFSKMIAREGVFLMELLLDSSRATIPLPNLEKEITVVMANMKIKATVQQEDVFNKKKRLIVFSVGKGLMPLETALEIARHTGAELPSLVGSRRGKGVPASCREAVRLLDNLPEEVLEKLAGSAKPAAATQELAQTLKTMGYRLDLAAPAAVSLVEHIARLLGIDDALGITLPVDPDTRRIDLEAAEAGSLNYDEEGFIAELIGREKLQTEDVTVIGDRETERTPSPGIRLEWEIKTILDLWNSRV
ncbi:MAG TPA: hypothetical protein ENN69_02150, partial [Spirochaetia bacterium]|nr:hypothetical protein [Spirochaetia bacterium]